MSRPRRFSFPVYMSHARALSVGVWVCARLRARSTLPARVFPVARFLSLSLSLSLRRVCYYKARDRRDLIYRSGRRAD